MKGPKINQLGSTVKSDKVRVCLLKLMEVFLVQPKTP